ncbi:MAG TPA: acyl-CoA dehydrogenase family protein [Limnochordales bacterium]
MTDFFRIDELFTPEERAVRDMVREFVQETIVPVAGRLWEKGEFPKEWPRLFGERGLLGANLPEEYGGAGVSNIAYGLIMQELEAGDSGVRSFASVQGALVMYPIYKFGSEEQKRYWLPRLAKGEAVGCFGLTETSAGSDPASMTTRARKQNGGWVLNGTKMWITNGNLADVAVIWAKDDDGEIRGFLVETNTPGFTAVEIKEKASMRLSNTSQLFLDNVRVSDDARLPNAKGLRAPLECLTQARYGIAWGVLGAARACYEEALRYALHRESFGRPIAARQIIQERLVDMLTELTKGQLVAYRLGQLKDAGTLHYTQVSLAKRNNVRQALNIARQARTILGAYGITLGHQAIRHAANLETVDTYEGTYDIHTLILGREITGLEAF